MMLHIRTSDLTTSSAKQMLRSEGNMGTMLLLMLLAAFTLWMGQSNNAATVSLSGLVSSAKIIPMRPLEAQLSAPNPPAVTMTAASAVVAVGSHKLSLLVKPVLIELGTIVLLQSIGLPVVTKLLWAVRRMRWTSAIRLSAAPTSVKVALQTSGRAWKQLVGHYSRTSASKLVNRGKKMAKIFLSPKHVEDDH